MTVMSSTPLVDVAFQNLSILQFDHGRSCFFGYIDNGNEDFKDGDCNDDTADYMMLMQESDCESDDVSYEFNTNQNTRRSITKPYMNCFRNPIQFFNVIKNIMHQIPTVYCIECVAMISPSSAQAMSSLPSQKQLSSSTHESGVLTVSTNSSPRYSDPDQGKHWMKKKIPTLISTGLRSWKVWRRYSDFFELEQKISSRVGQRVNGVFPEPFSNLPRLPGKNFFQRFDQEFITDRCILLQRFLVALLQSPHFVHSFEEIQVFFGVEDCIGGNDHDHSEDSSFSENINLTNESYINDHFGEILVAEEKRGAQILDKAIESMIPTTSRSLLIEARNIQSYTAILNMDKQQKRILSHQSVRQAFEQFGENLKRELVHKVPQALNSDENLLSTLSKAPISTTLLRSSSLIVNNALNTITSDFKASRSSLKFGIKPEDEIVCYF